MTMTSSAAANISQRCPTHTTSTFKASSTITELTVSKADPCGIDNRSFHPSTLLREIPTRNPPFFSTDAVVDHVDDDNERRQQTTHPSLPNTADETKTTHQPRTPSCDDVDSFDYKSELAEITTRCEAMQQRWSLMTVVIDQNPAIKEDAEPSDYIQQPDPSHPQQIQTTLANVAAPCTTIDRCATDEPPSLLHESQCLLVTMQQQSQALRNLTEMSEKLLELMTQVVCAFAVLVPDQPPPKRYTLAPTNLRLPTTNSTIHSTKAHVPNIQPQRIPPTWHPDTPYARTIAPPWPHHPNAPFPKPAPTLKPQPTSMKRIPEKPFAVRGCQGMLWTKDNLRPP